jgi:hypothetical protein
LKCDAEDDSIIVRAQAPPALEHRFSNPRSLDALFDLRRLRGRRSFGSPIEQAGLQHGRGQTRVRLAQRVQH